MNANGIQICLLPTLAAHLKQNSLGEKVDIRVLHDYGSQNLSCLQDPFLQEDSEDMVLGLQHSLLLQQQHSQRSSSTFSDSFTRPVTQDSSTPPHQAAVSNINQTDNRRRKSKYSVEHLEPAANSSRSQPDRLAKSKRQNLGSPTPEALNNLPTESKESSAQNNTTSNTTPPDLEETLLLVLRGIAKDKPAKLSDVCTELRRQFPTVATYFDEKHARAVAAGCPKAWSLPKYINYRLGCFKKLVSPLF